MMPQEIVYDEKVTTIAHKTKYFFICYDDGLTSDPKEFLDDYFVHISYKKYRFVFYNGDERGRLTKRHLPRFKAMVRKVMKAR